MNGFRMVLVIIAFASAGCQSLKNAQKSMQSATNNQPTERLTPEEQRAKLHDQYIGLTEDEMIEALGAPEKIEQVSSFKIYYYITDHGMETKGSSYDYGGKFGNSSWSNVSSKAHSQQSRFYFKNGKVTKWDYAAN